MLLAAEYLVLLSRCFLFFCTLNRVTTLSVFRVCVGFHLFDSILGYTLGCSYIFSFPFSFCIFLENECRIFFYFFMVWIGWVWMGYIGCFLYASFLILIFIRLSCFPHSSNHYGVGYVTTLFIVIVIAFFIRVLC